MSTQKTNEDKNGNTPFDRSVLRTTDVLEKRLIKAYSSKKYPGFQIKSIDISYDREKSEIFLEVSYKPDKPLVMWDSSIVILGPASWYQELSGDNVTRADNGMIEAVKDIMFTIWERIQKHKQAEKESKKEDKDGSKS
jgi:hypothetical protein